MKVGSDRDVPLSACTNCGHLMDQATGVSEDDSDPTPSAHSFTICIRCGHIMAFAEDLTLRDLSDEERIMVAGDKRMIAIQRARAIAERDRAYCEDFVREMLKRGSQDVPYRPSVEMINGLVDRLLMTIPKPPRKAR